MAKRIPISLLIIMLASVLVAWFGRSGLERGWLESIDGWASTSTVGDAVGRIFEWIAATASTVGLIVGTLIMLVLLVLRGRIGDSLVLLAAAATAAIAQSVLKEWVGRPRPEGYLLAETGSFPSGQTFVAIAVYGLFALFLARSLPSTRARIITWVVTLLYLVAVSYGRLAVGAHYLSDVLASVFLGLVWLIAALRLRPRTARKALTLGTRYSVR